MSESSITFRTLRLFLSVIKQNPEAVHIVNQLVFLGYEQIHVHFKGFGL